MPLNKPRFRNEVTDIADQLAHLGEHRERLLEADSIRVLDSALEAMEHSVDILRTEVQSRTAGIRAGKFGPPSRLRERRYRNFT
jgi:hypothetical protein